MKSFTQNEIIDLIKDTNKLKQAIIESKGFILYQADVYKIDISKNILMEAINPYSIRYITEHMKTFDYSTKEVEVITSFLKEDNDYEEKEVILDYNLNKLLEDLTNEKVPRNVHELIKISFDDFIKNQELLIKILDRSDDEYSYREDKFNTYHKLLNNVFKNITKEDFLKININTLVKAPSLFNMAKHLMTDKDIKELFNNVINLYHEQSEIKKGGYKPKLQHYQNYNFDKSEKELFIQLIKNEYNLDYKKIQEHKSFDIFFTKMEYILNYNIESIEYLSKKEISENIDEIRVSLKNYKRFEQLYNLRIDEASFKEIFSKEFIKELITAVGDFEFTYFDRDYKKKTNFINYFHKHVYDLAANEPEILKIVTFTSIMRNLSNLIENNRNFYDDEYKESVTKILPQLDTELKTVNLFNNIEKNSSSYENTEINKAIIESMQGKETINYLFFLLKIVDSKNNFYYKEEIDRIIPLLNKFEVLEVANLFNYKINTKLLNNKNDKVSSYEDNFLNFKVENIYSMSNIVFNNTLLISSKFRTLVIQNNFDNKIIQNINNNKRENIIASMLNLLKEKNSPYVGFMKTFISKNKDYMLNNYFNELITHSIRHKIIDINTKELENNSYQKIDNLFEKYKVLKINHLKQNLRNLDNLSKKEKNIEYKKNEILNEEVSNLEKEFKNESKNMSFNFCEEKIKNNDIVKSILLEEIFQNSHRDTLMNLITNLKFDKVKELLNDSIFLKYIEAARKDDNRGNKDTKFLTLNPKFTDFQNIELVEIMLKNFNDPNFFQSRYEKKITLSKVLSLIDETSRYRISNDLVVKHDPENMFNSYDYLPEKEGYYKKNVIEQFSTQQILQAIENLNKEDKKIMCVENQNLSHYNLLRSNYEFEENKRNKKNGTNPYLNEYLDLLKNLENDPINYLACIHSNIIEKFIDNSSFKYMDEAKSYFYNEHININVVLKAMDDIFDLAKEKYDNKNYDEKFYKGIVIENGIKAINNFIGFSYSDSDNKHVSSFTEEKSKLILEKILEKAPYLFFNSTKIGIFKNVDEVIEKNINEYYNESFIEKFFINSSMTRIDGNGIHFSYDKKDQWQSSLAHNMVNMTIDYLINTENNNDLHKLDFILKEYEFNDKQRGYSKHIYDFNAPLTEFANHAEYKLKIEKGLLFMNLARETNEVTIQPTKNKKNKL